jgi:hypothetical protein
MVLQCINGVGSNPVKQNIDNAECFGVKLVKIYPEMISQ